MSDSEYTKKNMASLLAKIAVDIGNICPVFEDMLKTINPDGFTVANASRITRVREYSEHKIRTFPQSSRIFLISRASSNARCRIAFDVHRIFDSKMIPAPPNSYSEAIPNGEFVMIMSLTDVRLKAFLKGTQHHTMYFRTTQVKFNPNNESFSDFILDTLPSNFNANAQKFADMWNVNKANIQQLHRLTQGY